MRSFLLKGDDSLVHNEEYGSKVQNEARNIIVETNFQVYCYTETGLYRAIIDIFCKVDFIFYNFVCGMLTREKVREAFKKGISANQIAMFLNKHAHENMYKHIDQEEEKDEPKGILVGGKHAIIKTNHTIDQKKMVIPQNVVDQLNIWEDELNLIKAPDGLMVSDCDSKEKYEQFKGFLKKKEIEPLSFNDSTRIIIVKEADKKEAYKFLNTSL